MLSSSDALYQRGLWAWERGLPLLAEECWERWLNSARRAGDKTAVARGFNALGCVHYELGQVERAQALWKEAWALMEADPGCGPHDRLKVMTNLALAASMTGRLDEAPAYLRAAQRCAGQVDLYWRAHADHTAASMWIMLEQWDEAEAAARRALALFGGVDDDARVAQLQCNMGLICLQRGDHTHARAYLEAARDMLERLGVAAGLGHTYCALGRLHYLMGELDQAVAYGSEALRVLWSNVVTLHKSEVAHVSELFGSIALATGDRHTALMDLQRASTYFAQSSLWGQWSRVNRQLDELVRQRSSGSGRTQRGDAIIHPESKERLRYFTTLLDLLDSIETLYPEMRQKAELTGRYALRLGQVWGLSPHEQEALSHAAKLHNIGVTSLDPEVVGPEESLSPVARDRLKAHPLFGEKILSLFPIPSMCRHAVRHHRERYDGLGFPDGLSGEDIPLLARIIAVAGTYVSHALDHGHTAAMDEIIRRKGRQLDPHLVDAFVALHNPKQPSVAAGGGPMRS